MTGKKLWTLLLVLVLVLAACTQAPKEAEEKEEAVGRLQLIKDRGKLICGCNAELPGFGYLNPQGEFEGFDINHFASGAPALLILSAQYGNDVLAQTAPANLTNQAGCGMITMY